MPDYLLPNYKLSDMQTLQSLVFSEYGKRHLDQARLYPERKWGHYLIAAGEFCPVLGPIFTLIEWVVFQMWYSNAPLLLYLASPQSLNSTGRIEQLFVGSQADCQGPTSMTRVARIVDRLNHSKENGIAFNRAKISRDITGGVCSAMAFDFADAFFQLRSVNASPGHPATPLFLNRLRALGYHFARSTEEQRIRQGAFNTIEVKRDATGIDVAKNKIQSLANLHRYKIDYASAPIQVVGQASTRIAIRTEMERMPHGLYLLRSIDPSNNEKREVHGHTMIYVKDEHEDYFYDPNIGLIYMRHVDQSSIMLNALFSCFYDFGISDARFYRLMPSVV